MTFSWYHLSFTLSALGNCPLAVTLFAIPYSVPLSSRRKKTGNYHNRHASASKLHRDFNAREKKVKATESYPRRWKWMAGIYTLYLWAQVNLWFAWVALTCEWSTDALATPSFRQGDKTDFLQCYPVRCSAETDKKRVEKPSTIVWMLCVSLHAWIIAWACTDISTADSSWRYSSRKILFFCRSSVSIYF